MFFSGYWLMLDRSISWIDSLELRIDKCASIVSLDLLQTECAVFTDIVSYLLINPPFFFRILNYKDLKSIRLYFDERSRGLVSLFNKKRLYLQVKKVI